jgi:hypothetical protein
MWWVEAMWRSPQLERSSLGMCECCHAIMSTREAQLTDELTALAQAAGEQRELAEEQRARLAERVRELQRLRSENARLRRAAKAQTEQVAWLRVAATAATADAAAVAPTATAAAVAAGKGARRRPPPNPPDDDDDVAAAESRPAHRGRLRQLLWRHMVRCLLLMERQSRAGERVERLEQEKKEGRVLLQHVAAMAKRLDLAARTIDTQATLIKALEEERDLVRSRHAPQAEGLAVDGERLDSRTTQLEPDRCRAAPPSADAAATSETPRHTRSGGGAAGRVEEAEPPVTHGTRSAQTAPTIRAADQEVHGSQWPSSVTQMVETTAAQSEHGEARATEDMWDAIDDYKKKHLACDWPQSELPVAAGPVSSRIPAVALSVAACATVMKVATALRWLWTASPLTLGMLSVLWLCWCQLLWVTWGCCHDSSAGRGLAQPSATYSDAMGRHFTPTAPHHRDASSGRAGEGSSDDESGSGAGATTAATLDLNPPRAKVVAFGATMLTAASCWAMWRLLELGQAPLLTYADAR